MNSTSEKKRIRLKSLLDRQTACIEKMLLVNKKMEDLCQEQKNNFYEYEKLAESNKQKIDKILNLYKKPYDIRKKVFIEHYLNNLSLVEIADKYKYSYKYIKNVNKKITDDLSKIE